MPGLPIDLSNRCRDTLLQCSEFSSHAALQAVFVTHELYPFRSDLPEADSKGERVARCLDYLLEQRATGYHPVLAAFLTALRDRYMPGNALRDELQALVRDVGVALSLPTGASTSVQTRYPSIPTLPQPYFAHPYPLQVNFTGRASERRMLSDWLTKDERSILALVAIGGMGKSSLAWYWLPRDVDTTALDAILWWSFYEGEASFSRFLDEALVYLSNRMSDPSNIPSNYDKVRTLVRLLQHRRILLVLDGFERQLQAYASLGAAYQGDETADKAADARACVDPNASRFLRDLAAGPTQGKVLITTRLMVRDLEDRVGDPLAGCRKEELNALHPDDAVAFMQAQGVTKGTSAEIKRACQSYGYHPLSMRLLSGYIARNKRTPGNIAAAPQYDVHADLVVRQHHVLEVAYKVLTGDLQVLLSQVAAFRSPVNYEALTILNRFGDESKFDAALDELIERGLIFVDKQLNRYDLHPIVRAYAYDQLVDKKGTHSHLRDYFAAIPSAGPLLSVDELVPVIELYHHCTRAGFYEEAIEILRHRLNEPLYTIGGEYRLFIELLHSLHTDEGHLPTFTDPDDLPWALNKLALCYERTGKSSLAVETFQKHISVRETMNYRPGVAIGLGNLSEVLIRMGLLKQAAQVLERKISITRQIGDRLKEIIGRQDLGLLLAYQGRFEESRQQLDITREWLSERAEKRDEGVTWAHYTMLQLLQAKDALEYAQRTLDLADIEHRERDLIRAEWLLGRAYMVAGDLIQADIHLTEALARCRRIDLTEFEPDILLALSYWHRARQNKRQARDYAEEALTIADHCEYRLKQADIHNFLALWELDAGDNVKARKRAEIAAERAWCDGPLYCYKPALDEAERLLREVAQHS